jgi:hypothetical protein
MSCLNPHIEKDRSGTAGRSAPPCDRTDLANWTSRGGPLPLRLQLHVARCPGCEAQVRRVNRLHASFALLRTQAAAPDLLARANGRALRMLRRAARASAAAQRLLVSRPNLTVLQRVHIHAARLSLSAVAAGLALLVRAGLLAGIDQTRTLDKYLATRNWDGQFVHDAGWPGGEDTHA